MINIMEMENILIKMVNIILVNGHMEIEMEKENYIIKIIVLNMKVILIIIHIMEKENIFMKMVNITLVNG